MTRALLTFIFSAFAAIQYASCCSGGSSKCSYTTCSNQYLAWSPAVGRASCRWQVQRANHIFAAHQRSSGCPGSTTCSERDNNRFMCNCKVIATCTWGGWGQYTGTIARGTCGTQTRYRYPIKTYRYEYKLGSCSSAVTTCRLPSDSQSRKWCNCQKAETCAPTNWTPWAGSVPNGGCARQTSTRDFIATYRYIQQQNNCHGFNDKCSPSATNTRTFCMCPYRSCTEQDWTQWGIVTSSRSVCPKEERLKRWTFVTRYKEAHSTCTGVGTETCHSDRREERAKAITCPKQTSPAYGTLTGIACDGVRSSCGGTCQVDCRLNYPLQGNGYATCQANGQWSKQLGLCKDSIKPVITCPKVPVSDNIANKNYAMVVLPSAVATDNSGISPKITIDNSSPVKVVVGQDVKVTYTATDAAGNTAPCSVMLIAKDVEPPKVESCPPNDMIFHSTTDKYTVVWTEPTFSDNVQSKSEMIVVSTHSNGGSFNKGTKTTVTYTARDSALNEVKCVFNVQISEKTCKQYDPPKHGAYDCNIKNNGAEKLFMCSVACKQNFWFLQGASLPKLYDYYICADDGSWKGQTQFDFTNPGAENLVAIPNDRSPWPDCSAGKPPAEASKPFTVIGGSCTAADVAKLKLAFAQALTSDPIVQYLFCMNENNCHVKNFEVKCSSVRKRSTGTMTNAMHITFEFIVRDKNPSKSQRTEMSKMTTIISNMATLGNEVKRVAQTQLKTTAANVILQERSAELACEAGFVFSVVNGAGSKNDRSKCVKCPIGTQYIAATKTCEVCPQGAYQDVEGENTCKSCPNGLSTHGYQKHNFTSCKKICSPGTFSSTGLATCIACAKGTFQPLKNSTSCLSCPVGKGTAKVGSALQSDCEQRAIHVEIRSEGADDRHLTTSHGYTTIKVDGVDRSPHRRGYNMVVVNEETGAVERVLVFDTHATTHASVAMNNYLRSLAVGKIVLIAIQEEASRFTTSITQQALMRMKGSLPLQTQYGSAFAMIGYKGDGTPSWVQQVKTNRYSGPAMINTNVLLA